MMVCRWDAKGRTKTFVVDTSKTLWVGIGCYEWV